jgi:hypothetical protein
LKLKIYLGLKTILISGNKTVFGWADVAQDEFTLWRPIGVTHCTNKKKESWSPAAACQQA